MYCYNINVNILLYDDEYKYKCDDKQIDKCENKIYFDIILF